MAMAMERDVGVRESDPFNLMVGCEACAIEEVADFPNPDFVEQETGADVAKVMIGGNAVRYFNVVNRRTGKRVPDAQVTIEISGRRGKTTIVVGTNANGGIDSHPHPDCGLHPAAPP